MIRAPADYSPLDHPERRQGAPRLGAAAAWPSSGWVDPGAIDAALARAAAPSPQPRSSGGAPPTSPTPWPREAEERFGVDELGGRRLRPLLDLSLARPAGGARRRSSEGLAALEKGYGEGAQGGRGRCRRRWSRSIRGSGAHPRLRRRPRLRASQFDRAGRRGARPGSAFKPMVYAAAFEEGDGHPGLARSRTRRSPSGSATAAGARRTTTAASTAG